MRSRARARLGLACGLAIGALLVTVVPASRPDTAPGAMGPVAVADVQGSLEQGMRGPLHVDPLPVGVRLSDPVDTDSLLERAGDVEAVTASADAPVGTPGIRGLDSHVVPSCSGTGTDGKRVQVIYVHDQSTTSRFDQVLALLRNEVANVDDVFALSAEQTGGDRRVRWVHDATCLPVVRDVTVPDGALGASFGTTVAALKKLGFTDRNRKYLAFADADQLCGIGTLYNDTRLTGNQNDGYAASYARVDATCWSTSHSVAAHELTHNLGGVQQGAPHATVNGHCWDDSDLMCYDDGSGVRPQQVCPPEQESLLDCNHDDYFSTAPAAGTFLAKSWNVASSGFLDPGPAAPGPAPSPVVTGTPVTPQPTVAPVPLPTTRTATRVDGRPGRHRADGTLRTVAGERVPGVRVVLQRRVGGSARWGVVARPRSDRTGHVSVRVTPRRATTWRWVFAGDVRRGGAVSPVFTVRR
ncbi:MAG: hypothetical protein ABIQ59_13035 [Nocardioidaceae bacterium]